MSSSFDVIRSRASVCTAVNQKRLILKVNCWQTTNPILNFFSSYLALIRLSKKIIFAEHVAAPQTFICFFSNDAISQSFWF